jgi:hypothetical protein
VTVARGVGAAAVLALLVAEVLPWATLGLADDGTDGVFIGTTGTSKEAVSAHILDLPVGVQVGLHVGWMLLLGLLGIALFGPTRLRRTLSAGAGGVAAGLLALMLSLVGASLEDNGAVALFGATGLGLYRNVAGSQGPGVFCAALAALLAVVTAILAFRSAPGVLPALPGYPAPADASALPGGPGLAGEGNLGTVAPGYPGSGVRPGIVEPVGAPDLAAFSDAGPTEGSNGGRQPGRPAHAQEDRAPLDLTVSAVKPADHQPYQRPTR